MQLFRDQTATKKKHGTVPSNLLQPPNPKKHKLYLSNCGVFNFKTYHHHHRNLSCCTKRHNLTSTNQKLGSTKDAARNFKHKWDAVPIELFSTFHHCSQVNIQVPYDEKGNFWERSQISEKPITFSF